MLYGKSIWKRAAWLYALIFYFLLYAPILSLVILSFNDSMVPGLPLKGFTLRWYRFVLHSDALKQAFFNSFTLGIVSSVIATALALLLAMGFRRSFLLKSLLMKVILLPILIPGIVSGVVFLIFFGYMGLPFGLWTTVLIVHVTWVLPFSFLTIYPRLHGFDKSLEEAAMDLGAPPMTVFRRIVFPIIRPGVVATILFGFTLSFDEFIRTFLVIRAQRTIPVHLWTLLVSELEPYLPAIGVVIMIVSMMVSAVGFVASARDSGAKGT
jgi:ABC-type spermidine/putrescine transport system permease subunit II